jgi:hypothetical protein
MSTDLPATLMCGMAGHNAPAHRQQVRGPRGYGLLREHPLRPHDQQRARVDQRKIPQGRSTIRVLWHAGRLQQHHNGRPRHAEPSGEEPGDEPSHPDGPPHAPRLVMEGWGASHVPTRGGGRMRPQEHARHDQAAEAHDDTQPVCLQRYQRFNAEWHAKEAGSEETPGPPWSRLRPDAPPGQDGRGGRQHRDQRHGVAWGQQRDQQRDGQDGKAKARHALEGGREKDHAGDEQPLCHATSMQTLERGETLCITL